MTEFWDMRNMIEQLDDDARWLVSDASDRQLHLDTLREMDVNAKRLIEMIGEAIKVRYK